MEKLNVARVTNNELHVRNETINGVLVLMSSVLVYIAVILTGILFKK